MRDINWHLFGKIYFRLETSIHGVGSLHSYLPTVFDGNYTCTEKANGHVEQQRCERALLSMSTVGGWSHDAMVAMLPDLGLSKRAERD